jgi:hypothetical protein
VYTRLRRELDGNVLYADRVLYVDYTNETADSTARYEVIALEEGNKSVHAGTLELKRGGNRLDVVVPRRTELREGASYLFRLRNSRGEYWQLKFVYQSEK